MARRELVLPALTAGRLLLRLGRAGVLHAGRRAQAIARDWRQLAADLDEARAEARRPRTYIGCMDNREVDRDL